VKSVASTIMLGPGTVAKGWHPWAGDIWDKGTYDWFVTSCAASPGDWYCPLGPFGQGCFVRHNGGENYCMVDGHVKWLRMNQAAADASSGMPVWFDVNS